MALSIDVGPMKVLQYSCDQIGLSCNPMEQTKSKLVPWCCMYAANHIIKAMNINIVIFNLILSLKPT